ncbi:MAG: outer membrane beta-barrel protein, partial [Bythopirellula sp.]
YNSEPFTHTGVLGTYSGFENMTLYGGWTLGWDTGFDQSLQGNSFLGGASLSLGDNVTVTYINTYGNFGLRSGGQNDSYSHSVVADVQLTDKFHYVAQSDMVSIDDLNGTLLGNDQVGINQYLFWDWNDIVSFGSRIEWWKSDGVSFQQYTSGANIQLLDNMIIRPEFRTDWVPGIDVAGTSYDETMFGCDCILTY